MSKTGEAATSTRTIQYANGASADTTTWIAAGTMANWIEIIGIGSTAVLDEGGASRTYTTDASQPNRVVTGVFSAFASTTATRVTMGSGPVPPAPGVMSVAPVNLAGGPSAITGVLPGPSIAAFAVDPTTHSAAFTAVAGTLHRVNMNGATFAIAMPATSSATGQQIAIVNVSTSGSTASVVSPAGSDSIGNTAASTGATLAGPARGAGSRYTADPSAGAWLTGF